MSNAHRTSRSAEREQLPIELRVYGLEGIASTQDEAIMQQGLTLAEHNEKLGGHDVAIAILTTQVAALVTSQTGLNSALTKGVWTLIGFAFTIAAAAVGVVLGT